MKPGRVGGDRHKGRQLMVRMEPELYAAIQADAEAEERTMAQTVRFAVKQYLNHPEPSDGTESAHTDGDGQSGHDNEGGSR